MAGLGWPVGERESQRKEEQDNPSRGSGHWRSGKGWEAGQQPPGLREALGREKNTSGFKELLPFSKSFSRSLSLGASLSLQSRTLKLSFLCVFGGGIFTRVLFWVPLVE